MNRAAEKSFRQTGSRSMTFLMRAIALGKEKYGLPELEKGKVTSVIR